MKRFQRGAPAHAALIAMLAGVLIALWPLGQAAYGIWSQRSPQAAWQEAVRLPAPQPRAQFLSERFAHPSRAASRSAALSSATSASPGAGKHTSPSPRGTATKGKATKRSAVVPRTWEPMQLIIPDIGLEAIVVQGVDEAALQRGRVTIRLGFAGRMGRCIIAGHRNAYGWWFYRLGGWERALSSSFARRARPHLPRGQDRHCSHSKLRCCKTLPKRAAPRLTLYTCAAARLASHRGRRQPAPRALFPGILAPLTFGDALRWRQAAAVEKRRIPKRGVAALHLDRGQFARRFFALHAVPAVPAFAAAAAASAALTGRAGASCCA